mmetsp:Transcript_10541/g.23336  ORF Transcript_10541/g.23336 Transcript_10541/m.23336 type:complete len:384 (-) Transcript_10541:78-1229(-)|eukprot:CAMPEP_0168744224 /NCGR_PEP_ID=MMETSP0724-20121128/13980_1 /TAXON_ID=265536 /ORGANISM="Amphiprora sp., Strain CCMP467" /LENGTH=383 /DNA_ID=CAMNT_0008791875 /DNA_START=115 /DNA_END=1266 /DNA_ORIENTATION=+
MQAICFGDSQVREWLHEATFKHDSHAQYCLGKCYYEGRHGIHRARANRKSAVRWWRKAALQNNKHALYRLGECYRHEHGLYWNSKQDLKQAAHYYSLAAHRGHVEAQSQLGLCYKYGYGVRQDAGQAYYWMVKAAREGQHAEAMYHLGFWFAYGGAGLQRDLHQAMQWLEAAQRRGSRCGRLMYEVQKLIQEQEQQLMDLILMETGNHNNSIPQQPQYQAPPHDLPNLLSPSLVHLDSASQKRPQQQQQQQQEATLENLMPSIQVMQDKSEMNECPCCFEPFDDINNNTTTITARNQPQRNRAIMTECGHLFCLKCLTSICQMERPHNAGKCAICRGRIHLSHLKRVVFVHNDVNEHYHQSSVRENLPSIKCMLDPPGELLVS